MIKPVNYGQWVREAKAKPEQAWLVPGFVPADSLIIVAGRPKHGRKSWVAYTMAWAIASGEPIGPFKPTGKYPVLYIDLEGNEREAAKRPDLMRGGGHVIPYMDEHPMWQAFGQPFKLTNKEHMEAALSFIEEHGIKAVFIDTYAKATAGIDENSSKDVGPTLDSIDDFKRMGCSVVLVHHLRKGHRHEPGEALDPSASLRGSGALEGGFDHIVSIQRATVLEGEDRVSSDFWLVGGKYMPYQAYKVLWEEEHDKFVRLKAGGPMDVPVVAPPEKGPFGGRARG